MNDSRLFKSTFSRRESAVSASPYLPLMQERRAPPPLPSPTGARHSEPDLARSKRVSKSSSRGARQSDAAGFLPPTHLPYLAAPPPRTTPRSSSLPSSSLHHPSNAATLHARRNFSVSALPPHAPSPQWEDPRPRSFPPLRQRGRLPPRALPPPDDPAQDPFTLHADRILRPAASSAHLSQPAPFAPPFPSSPSSSDVDCPTPFSRRYSTQHRPQSSLRRTATVRSAHRHSRAGSLLRGGTRERLFAAVSASNSAESVRSASPARSFGLGGALEMRRDPSGGSESVYSQDSFAPAWCRGGSVLVEADYEHDDGRSSVSVSGAGDDLARHWEAFVRTGAGAGTPLVDQTPPPGLASSPSLRSRAPEPAFPPVRNVFMDASPSPVSTSVIDALSSRRSSFASAPRTSRDFSTALPRTSTHLTALQRAPHKLPLSPSFEVRAGELASSMARVDSEVLLSRLTLRRLGSTGFEGDALDRLGREEHGHEQEQAEEWEDEDFSDRYRDSYDGWERSTSSGSLDSTASGGSAGSSSSSSRQSSSRWSGSVKAWAWRPSNAAFGYNAGGGMSASSSATSLGSLRRWSKSTLMDELEREFAELSEDLQRQPSGSTVSAIVEEPEDVWQDDDDEGYVCALDLLLDSESDKEENAPSASPLPPPRPPPIAPLSTPSRLPRLKAFYISSRESSPTSADFPPPASTLPSSASLLPRLIKPRAAAVVAPIVPPAPPARLEAITQALHALHAPDSIDWFILRTKASGNRLHFHDAGSNSFEGLRARLVTNDVQFGLIKLGAQHVLWSLIPTEVGGVKRARALVTSRALASALRSHTGVLNAASIAEVEPSGIQARSVQNSPSFNRSPPPQHSLSPTNAQSPHFGSVNHARFPSPQSANFAQQKPPTPTVNGLVAGASNLSLRSNSPPQHTLNGSSPSYGHFPSTTSPQPPQQHFTSGYPSHLGPMHDSGSGAYNPSDSPTNGTAPHAFPTSSSSRKGSLATSHLTYTPAGLPPAASGPGFEPRSPSPDPTSEWQPARERERLTSPSSPSLRVSGPAAGLFESAAAAMLAPLTPDPAAAGGAGNGASAPTSVPVSSAASLKPSVQSVPVDVEPSEDEDDADDWADGDGEAKAQAAQAAARAQREEAARLNRERREREAEDAARAEAERVRAAEVEAEETERRMAEEEARLRAEEEAAERRRVEEARRAEEEARRQAEEDERTRLAEEEMRLLIERQRLEKRMKEEAEARTREEEQRRREEQRVREAEERRRALVKARDEGGVMLRGMVSVQGGNSMFWKRRHFQLSALGLALYKSETETDQPLDVVPLDRVVKLTDGVEDALVPNSFKLTFQDDDEYAFYTGEREEKEMLVAGLRCAARLA
ncbi:hypothetical protein JCM10207_000657 [Rhodosporidiobolus poonsookiae]